ncbi:hypothetical protein M1B72_21865 [Geomonas paludis]|uniref:ApeI dehydratase-like domain-containing protein n=1 Tax=Geomonas paludis TaxID=2740185 RepID=A0A6V8MQL1_9BACT|nr:hypothetical protein [Geomonas paludis]UPU36052.1 hypothetical protein M1B72_21865 [Geomonas paludis]GFO62356.1 hypothetical protein GMPD_02750 [Geomonas paludis]
MNSIIAKEITASRLGAESDSEGGCRGRYRFDAGFAGFDGHFPGFPILPAIVEIHSVVSLVGAVRQTPQRLVSVQDAKFLNPVRPGQELQVACRPRTVQGKELCDAKLTVGEVTVATMLLELALEESP